MGAAVLAGFDAGAIGFVLPALRAATGVGAQQAAGLLGVFVAATLVAVPLCAGAVQRWGAVTLLRGCLALAAVSAGLAAVLPGFTPVLVARALQGLAHGPLLPLAAAVIVLHGPPERQGRWLGLVSMGYGLAYVAAMLGTPSLLQHGWRSAFAVCSVLALVCLLLPLPGESRRPARVGAGSASLIEALPQVRDGPRFASAIGWGGLRALWSAPMVVIAALALGTGMGQAVLVWLPTVAVLRLGVSLGDTPVLLLPLLAGGLAATAVVTVALDRLGARRLAVVGVALSLAGLAAMLLLEPTRGGFMGAGALLGSGIAVLCGGPLRYAAARARPAAEQGLAQGAVAWITNVGLLGGTLLLGAVSAGGAGARHGLEAALLLLGGLMLLAFLPTPALAAHRIEPPLR